MNAPPLLLLDERARPSLRERVGRLLASGDDGAFAVARIRLAVLDLDESEIGQIRRCRVLLGQLDASMLADAARGPDTQREGNRMAGLLRFARSGRLEVRSVGLGGWTPDFAIVSGPSGCTGVIGSIHFGNPELALGPALTVVTSEAEVTQRLLVRFEELWAGAHDVLPAIREVLERAHGLGGEVAEGRGDPDAL
jgi:hypothetical protein